MGRRFTARYPGRCRGCCRRIHPGETVTYSAEVLVHTTCAGDLPETPTTTPVSICWDCWQERAVDGSCRCED